jgi:hypothetical protein
MVDTKRGGKVVQMRSVLMAAAAVTAVASGILFTGTAQAQNLAREAEIRGLHQLCEKGDRRACVRFGMILGEMRERHGEWRRAHAEWFWWER